MEERASFIISEEQWRQPGPQQKVDTDSRNRKRVREENFKIQSKNRKQMRSKQQDQAS